MGYSFRNSLAFLIFGICNSYVFVIMLSAAGDIVDKEKPRKENFTDVCFEDLTEPQCSSISTVAVLLATIIPSILSQTIFLFFMQKVPFGITQSFVIICQASGLIIAAYAATVSGSLIGVILASFGGGVGAVNILALATHFPKETVKSWSTGWGAAGIVASLCYAAFTEAHFANLSIKTTLLLMLGSPIIYAIAYWIILEMPKTVHQVEIFNYKSYFIRSIKVAPVKAVQVSPPTSEVAETAEMALEKPEKEEAVKRNLGFIEKLKLFVVFKKYTVPLFFVYFGQYLINQGLAQLIYFDCSNGLNLSLHSQYRWYQVFYQIGGFVACAAVHCIHLPQILLYLCPIVQLLIAAFLTADSMLFLVPNITIIFPLLILEGLITGSSYGNTIYRIHADVPTNIKEIVMSTITVAYSLGTVSAAFTAIPLHNYICDKQIAYFM